MAHIPMNYQLVQHDCGLPDKTERVEGTVTIKDGVLTLDVVSVSRQENIVIDGEVVQRSYQLISAPMLNAPT